MKRFERVRQYLEQAVDGEDIQVHGNFWRTLDVNSFKTFVVPVHGGVQLLIVGNGADSNLIKALKGQLPFGKDQGVAGATYNRMPDGYDAMPGPNIDYIEKWIDDNCPDEEESPATADRP